jgi:hypothetical protein
MLAGLREQVRPVPDETETASVTVPVNPLIGDIVMVDVPVAPARMVKLVGLAETEKSGTVTL